LIRLVAEAAGIGDGSLVCDVGCGYGGTARFLASEYSARVTGLTVSQAQFEYARQQTNGADNPGYLLRNWEENGFDESSFDALVSIECLAHVPDKQKYFDEIRRVLKPGGRAAILVWLSDETPRRWEVRHLLEPICREGRLPSMGSADEYKQMIAQAGLELEQFMEFRKQVRKTWWICARRLLGKLCTSPRYMRALFDSKNGNRIFAVTLFRILTAYYTGAMQYGMFVMRKPGD
jgi:tocopherol O-methyltransferase